MSNVDLGTAHGKVEIDYDGTPLKRTKDDLDQVKSKGTSTGAALDKSARVMGRAGLVVAAGIGLAVKSAASFEKTISGISAVTGATGDQLDQVRNKALQLGRDTKFSAGEAAQAMEELAKAGISLPDIMNGAADATVALAAAGGIALPEAATIASNAMNQFALKAQDLPKVADLIAGAANSSAIDVGDFGRSISQAGAIAHSTGLSFQDTAVAIAVLGNAGIKGSDAGTSLKQALIQLASPTKRAKDLMHSLGIDAFDSTGHLKSLSAIAGNLQDGMRGLTPEARAAALSIIFGSDAARVGSVLFQNGATGVDKMSTALTKVKAADVAKKRMDNLSGSVEQLKGSVETTAIKIGEMGQGPLKDLVDSLTGVINAFSNLSEGTQQTILVIVASIGGLALFGAGLIKTVKFVKDLIDVLKVLRVFSGLSAVFSVISAGIRGIGIAMAFVAANPIILIIAAIIALGIAIVIAYKKSATFRNIVNGAFGAVIKIIKAVVGAFSDFFHGLTKGIDGLSDPQSRFAQFGAIVAGIFFSMARVVKVAFDVVVSVIRVAITIVKALITGAMLVIKAAWNIWSFFFPIVAAVFKLIVDVIKLFLAIINLILTAALVILYQAWKAAWNNFSQIVSDVFNIVKSIVKVALDIISDIFHNTLDVILAVVRFVMSAIHSLFNSWIGQKVVGVVRSGIKDVKSIFNGLSAIVGFVGKIFSSVYNTVKGKIDAVLKVIGGIGGRVIRALSGAGRWLINAGRAIIVGLINGIDSMIQSLINKVSGLTNLIKNFKGPPKKDAVLLNF